MLEGDVRGQMVTGGKYKAWAVFTEVENFLHLFFDVLFGAESHRPTISARP